MTVEKHLCNDVLIIIHELQCIVIYSGTIWLKCDVITISNNSNNDKSLMHFYFFYYKVSDILVRSNVYLTPKFTMHKINVVLIQP